MTKPTPYRAFGKLLIEGIKQTSIARGETSQQTHQFLADELGYAVNTLYVWRRGEHLPDNPDTVAHLARIFVKAWRADRRWVNEFLKKGEYGPKQAVDALNQELFGDFPDEAAVPVARVTPPIQNATQAAGEPQTSTAGLSHRLRVALFNFLTIPLLKFVESAPDSLTGGVLARFQGNVGQGSPETMTLFPTICGDKGLDLAEQRLLVSAAFGTYFAGLLERDHGYIHLKGQIEVQSRPEQAGLDPLQRLYWAMQYPKGPRLIVIAAAGGMGKSTLAAKLIRCLFEEEAADMILGDSAKNQQVDPVSGAVNPLEPGYYDPASFYQQLQAQLGLPGKAESLNPRLVLRNIRDRLEGRRAVIFVDNLETVERGTALLKAVQQLATRDTRVIVTTRTVSGLSQPASDILLVRLNPLTQIDYARDFLKWHIQTHAVEHPTLSQLESDIDDEQRVQSLIDRTGGIPLLMQLVLSDVARFSWQYLEQLPHLFGLDLLNFLYRERWEELGTLGRPGQQAQQLLRFVAVEQYKGKAITFERIRRWTTESGRAVESGGMPSPQPALMLLQERFLLVNHDLQQGNFAIFPSLAEFLSHQDTGSKDGPGED